MSTCGERSLYTSLCSRSGRKFNIFWSTKSDWYKRMLCHVQQYSLTEAHAFSSHSTAQMLPVYRGCLRQGSPVNLQVDLGQTITLRLFNPGLLSICKRLKGSQRLPFCSVRCKLGKKPSCHGNTTRWQIPYQNEIVKHFPLVAWYRSGRPPPRIFHMSSRLNIWQNRLDLQASQCWAAHTSWIKGFY